MLLDAHQHFWQYDPQRHAWIDESMQSIRRSFMPPDLEPLLQVNGVQGTVLVQVDQTQLENRFMLELAAANPWIKAVVGWIDLQAPDVQEQAQALQAYPLLRGFRHVAQAEPDAQWLCRPEVVRGIRAIGKLGFSYDILIYPHQLEAAIQLVQQCPDQPFVLDHLAKPYIREKDINGWRRLVQRLSAYENVFAKLSGLVTEAHWQHWQLMDIYPYLEVALQTFGTARLMWGSDWPVCEVAASYQQTLDLVQAFIAPLTAAEQAAIMGGNAARFYECVPQNAYRI